MLRGAALAARLGLTWSGVPLHHVIVQLIRVIVVIRIILKLNYEELSLYIILQYPKKTSGTQKIRVIFVCCGSADCGT